MKSALRFETNSDEETRTLGGRLARMLPERGVVLLIGELGAGPADEVSSPTFTLIHEYGDPVRVYHVDLYRLDTSQEARRVGLEELFERPALTLIEWGERFPELMPKERAEIRIVY